MEPRWKRLKRRHSNRDFFERLPDNLIIEHILPYLGTMKATARLSMVSRRFNRLCLWTPNLDFSDQTTITEEIAGLLDKFFDFHTNSKGIKFDIQRLNLRETGWIDLTTHQKMMSWIQRASSLNLQELSIQMRPRSVLNLPLVRLPSKSLRILSLKQVFMDEGNVKFEDWLLNCECLEELYLTNMNSLIPELKINSSSLRVLSLVTDFAIKSFSDIYVSGPKLRKLHIVWRSCGFGDITTLRIWAPSLENFSWIKSTLRSRAGVALDYSSVQSFQSLQSATIIFSKFDFIPLTPLLEDISQLKSLQVNADFIGVCSHPEYLRIISLDKLQHLHITFSVRPRYKGERSTKAIISFLRKFPCLKTLKFSTYGRFCNCNRNRNQQEFLESLECELSKSIISKLSVRTEANNLVAEIDLREGRLGEKLALHIIRHAPKGSEVTISYPSRNF